MKRKINRHVGGGGKKEKQNVKIKNNKSRVY